MEISKTNLLGVNFVNHSAAEILAFIESSIENKVGLKICFINDSRFFKVIISSGTRKEVNQFDIIIPKGKFLISQIQKLDPAYKYKDESTLDWISPILDKYKETNINFMVCGASQVGANKLNINLQASFPGIKLMGVYSKPFTIARTDDVRSMIYKGDVRVVFLGLRTPIDERWVLENQDILTHSVVLCLNEGLEILIGESKERGRGLITEILKTIFTRPIIRIFSFFFRRKIIKVK